MTGIILSGHGNFATGLTSSLELVVGKQTNFAALDFVEGATQEDLFAEMKNTVESMNECDKVIIFTDLLGGTPFKMGATLGAENDKVVVLCGTNLGMVIECALTRDYVDVETLVSNLLRTGKDQVMQFAGVSKKNDEMDDDGI